MHKGLNFVSLAIIGVIW